MRIFTTVSMGLALALAAGAAVPSQQSLPQLNAASSGKSVKMQRMSRADIVKTHNNGGLHKNVRKGAAVHKVAAPSENDEILGAPEGESVRYVKTGPGYAVNYMYVVETTVSGSVSEVVMKDGKFYMSNPCGTYLVPGWVEGTVADNEVTLKLPQFVEAYQDYTGATYSCYCMAMEYVEDDPETQEGWYYPTEAQEYKFKINADGTLIPTDPNVGLGLCTWFADEDSDDPAVGEWQWDGNLDLATEYGVLDKTPQVAPEGLAFDNWTLICEKTGQSVELAFADDGKVYLRDFWSSEDNAANCLVGKLDGDKVIFEPGQYLGVDSELMKTAYFVAGTYTQEYDELYGMYYYDFTPGGNLVLTFDADKKKMTSGDGGFIISVAPDELIYFSQFIMPELVKYNPDAVISKLNAPELVIYYEEDDYYPNECIFTVSNIDADGNMLDTSKLYYRVFVDNDLFTFYDDEYSGFTGEMTDVPYDFESDEFYVDGNMRDFVIYMSGIEKVEIQMLYKDGDNTVYSEKALMYGSNGVNDVNLADTVSSVYYDLAGRRVSNPASGVCIRLDRLSDGSVRAAKVMVK